MGGNKGEMEREGTIEGKGRKEEGRSRGKKKRERG